MKVLRSYAQRLRGLTITVLASAMAVGSVASAQASNNQNSSGLHIDTYAVLSNPLIGTASFTLVATVAALAAVGLHRNIVAQNNQEQD